MWPERIVAMVMKRPTQIRIIAMPMLTANVVTPGSSPTAGEASSDVSLGCDSCR
jgi:hypothetical protein